MTTLFKSEHIPKDVQFVVESGAELRCPQYHDKKGGVCNKLLCKGEASTKPQEFKCPNCGKKTTFVRK